MEWAAEAGGAAKLDPTAWAVLVALGYHASARLGRSFASAETVAALTGLSARRVRDAMGRLRAAKVVECRIKAGMAATWTFPTPPRTLRPGQTPENGQPRSLRPGPIPDDGQPRTKPSPTPDKTVTDPGRNVPLTRGNKEITSARARAGRYVEAAAYPRPEDAERLENRRLRFEQHRLPLEE
jgi:hypothetical protein